MLSNTRKREQNQIVRLLIYFEKSNFSLLAKRQGEHLEISFTAISLDFFIFSPKKIILFGMDFGNEIGKYSKHIVKNRQVKLKKLAYGKKLLEWFSTKSNSELYTTSKTIIGYKKINFADLDYIVNS